MYRPTIVFVNKSEDWPIVGLHLYWLSPPLTAFDMLCTSSFMDSSVEIQIPGGNGETHTIHPSPGQFVKPLRVTYCSRAKRNTKVVDYSIG